MKTPTARETQFQRSERLVSRVFKLIDAFDANNGLRSRDELYGDPLFDDGVAGAQRARTTRRAMNGTGKQ